MEIIRINNETIAYGQQAYAAYRNGVMSGLVEGPARDAAMERKAGRRAIVGAILAAINDGITDEDDLITTVSRVARCKGWTVYEFLKEFEGFESGYSLWVFMDGKYIPITYESDDRIIKTVINI